MKVEHQSLADVVKYIQNNSEISLEEKRPEYENYMRLLRRFHPIDASTRILEIGPGTGWFPMLCQLDGLQCKGLEISAELVDFAKKMGAKYGIEPDIEVGNIEERCVEEGAYDVVMARSVFEHIEHWRTALTNVYAALKPGGVFFFASENKFGLNQPEFGMPMYSWLPNSWRYWLRVKVQGPDVMKLGIDFNQFTYPELRAAFREVGFSRIHDRVQVVIENASGVKRTLLEACRKSPILRESVLTFSNATIFVCVK